MINKIEILDYFDKYYHVLVSEMKCCDHGNKNNKNIYHLEGSVHDHTKLVLDEIENFEYSVTLSMHKKLMLCGFLHDIGKIYTRTEIENKTYFKNHQNVSMFKAIEILHNCKAYFELSDDDIIEILVAINYHNIFFNVDILNIKSINNIAKKLSIYSDNTFILLSSLALSDNLGRITQRHYANIIDIINLVKKRINDIKNSNDLSCDKKYFVNMLVGLPYSGKSTYLEDIHGTQIVSRDNILTELYPDKTYNEAWNIADNKQIDSMLNNKLVECAKNNKSIYIDMTNLTNKSRNKKINIFNNKKYYHIATVFLTTESEICDRMNKRKNKSISEQVLNHMTSIFTLPTGDLFDIIVYIMPNGNKYTLKQ